MALLLHSHNLFSHMGEPNVQIQSARRYLVLHITYPGTTNRLDQFALELTAPAHHASSLQYIIFVIGQIGWAATQPSFFMTK